MQAKKSNWKAITQTRNNEIPSLFETSQWRIICSGLNRDYKGKSHSIWKPIFPWLDNFEIVGYIVVYAEWLFVTEFRTDKGERCSSYEGSPLWNRLPMSDIALGEHNDLFHLCTCVDRDNDFVLNFYFALSCFFGLGCCCCFARLGRVVFSNHDGSSCLVLFSLPCCCSPWF